MELYGFSPTIRPQSRQGNGAILIPVMGPLRRQGNGMVTVHVYYTVCLCSFSCVSAGMPYYFSFVVNGKRRFYPFCVNLRFKNAQNEMGNSKIPPKPKNF